MMKRVLMCLSVLVLLVGLSACGSDENGDDNNDEESDAGGEDADAGDGDDGGQDADRGLGDIAVVSVNVSHIDGEEWSLEVGIRNEGESAIEVDHCTYEAVTVEEGEDIADGTVYDDGLTLDPPDESSSTYATAVEFAPSGGEETVEAEMTVECIAAEGEEELDPDNNSATGTFDW